MKKIFIIFAILLSFSFANVYAEECEKPDITALGKNIPTDLYAITNEKDLMKDVDSTSYSDSQMSLYTDTLDLAYQGVVYYPDANTYYQLSKLTYSKLTNGGVYDVKIYSTERCQSDVLRTYTLFIPYYNPKNSNPFSDGTEGLNEVIDTSQSDRTETIILIIILLGFAALDAWLIYLIIKRGKGL